MVWIHTEIKVGRQTRTKKVLTPQVLGLLVESIQVLGVTKKALSLFIGLSPSRGDALP